MVDHYSLKNSGVREKDIIQTIIPIAGFLTVISQLPQFVEMRLSSRLSSIVWIGVFFLVCVLDKKVNFYSEIQPILAMSICVIAFWLVAGLIDVSYTYSAIARQLALSVFVLIVGLMCGRHMPCDVFVRFFTAYIWATELLALAVYLRYIRGTNINDLGYAYASKNSVSQIILTSVILIIVHKLMDGRAIKRILYGALALFNIYVLIALKSRACLIMLPIIAVVVISQKNFNKKLKHFLIVVLILVATAFSVSPKLYDIVVNQVLFIGRKGTDLESLSSGRFSQWSAFWTDFMQYPIFGHGGRHRESLVLTSYLEYGVVFGTFILLVAFYPIRWCFKIFARRDELFVTSLLIAICYAVNGVFEMLAPFGPGVKCFMLWFLVGAISSAYHNERLYPAGGTYEENK